MMQQLQALYIKLMPALKLVRHYLVFGVFMVFMLTYVLLMLRINQLSAVEPTDDQVNNKLQTIQRPTVDQQTLSKIQQLQDENIQVRTLFDQARQNPFSE